MLFFENAGALQTMLDATITMIITFAALVSLFFVTKAYSYLVVLYCKKQRREDFISANTYYEEDETQDNGDFSSGTLVLKEVDEPTAAMIMAIVSDESGIPLERLIFRSIKQTVNEEIT